MPKAPGIGLLKIVIAGLSSRPMAQFGNQIKRWGRLAEFLKLVLGLGDAGGGEF
jgi:hypothetical protein